MRMFFITLIAMVSMFSLIGCSPDIDEDEAVVDETMVTEEQTPSYQGPHWWDGTITVRTGVYETGAEMEEAIANRKNFVAYTVSTRARIIKVPMSKMSKVPGETEVTVLTLREVGMTGSPTMEEVREHFRKKGYRPLTLEEAVMIRLDFTDQPDTRTKHKMAEFQALLSREDGLLIGWRGDEWTFKIVRYAGWDLIGQGNMIDLGQTKGFGLDMAFACAKILP